MGIIGGRLGYRLLRIIAPRKPDADASQNNELPPVDTELPRLFGKDFPERVRGKTVIDFGCGPGSQSVAMALMGAEVIGLDIQREFLIQARRLAEWHKVSDRCQFATETDRLADFVLSKDAFEHYSNPADILQRMSRLLKPNGIALVSFGPPWLHPYGGHLFSVFPWAHLVFTEKALIRWRSDFKNDGATRFSEVAGGLNRMTRKHFKKFVAASPLKLKSLTTVPIKGLRFLESPVFREFGSSIVKCILVKPQEPQPSRTLDSPRLTTTVPRSAI